MKGNFSAHAVEWRNTARWRRRLLAALIVLPTVLAARLLVEMLPNQGGTAVEALIVALFAILFAWVSTGFWTSLMGFVTLIRGGDRFSITNSLNQAQIANTPLSKTAVIMPICNEDVTRVFKGLEAIYRSLDQTGKLKHYDFFVLSDSSDPDKWVEEELAWADLCQRVQGFDHVFYRMRRSSIKRKSGNVADFCRRWGANYEYMIVLDADSIMSGSTLVRLTQMMDANPKVGLIQTVPYTVNRESLYGRLQQFANRTYGPIFVAGLNYWQMGEAHFWGHNAIIRVKPFMEHCGLPRLKGNGSLGGEIMSHDFVEAALLRRGGWSIWLAYDLEGSYEETATTLPDDLKRDRRWSHGNLQHTKILAAQGLHRIHRVLFVNGVLAYVSAPLWYGLLVLSSLVAVQQAFTPTVYFGIQPSLFPQWPVSYQLWSLGLFMFTMCLLFLPKVLALIVMFRDPRRVRLMGGRLKLVFSVVLESLFSMVMAPIRMAVHSRFVILPLLGIRARWGTQQREDYELGWREAYAYHGIDTLVGIVWGTAVYIMAPDFFWWLTPVLAGFLLATPIAVYTSRIRLGLWAKRRGLFLIPEETDTPTELRSLTLNSAPTDQTGFNQAVVDPFVNALHVWCLKRQSGYAQRPWIHRERLVEKFLAQGANSLTQREKHGLLSDARAMAELHLRVWEGGEPQLYSNNM